MRKQSFYLLLSVFFIASFVSCSSVPKPITHQFTEQKKLNALHHWEILASDFSKQIATVMQEKPWPLMTSPGFGHATEDESNSTDGGLLFDLPYIYIPTNDMSDFGKSFRTSLITELIKLGYTITPTPEKALTVRWSVNKVRHNANRIASAFPASNTMAVAIGAGIYKLFDNSSSAFPGLIASGIALDLINTSGDYFIPNKVPHTEIGLTFTVSKDTIILSRQTQAYYVNAVDFDHYNNVADYAGQESFLKPVNFKVTTY